MALMKMSLENNQEDSGLEVVRGRYPVYWKPTSAADLANVEKRILKSVKSTASRRYVKLKWHDARIWTVALNTHHSTTPLVMVHGMGGGLAMWVQSMDALAHDRPVYMFDVLGFGRSSRPRFSRDPLEAERQLVDSLEEWREAVGLDKFILLGHSLGAFVSSLYAIRHPGRVEHLIVVDPWGYESKPEEHQETAPLWMRILFRFVFPWVNPFSILRAAGPLGPTILQRFRPDLQGKFADYLVGEADLFSKYIYHCNAQKPSGEIVAKTLQTGFRWAKHPILQRIHNLDSEIPMSFIHGEDSWLPDNIGYTVKRLRFGSHVNVRVIAGAGHHVYADRPDVFNDIVNEICTAVDATSYSSGPANCSEISVKMDTAL